VNAGAMEFAVVEVFADDLSGFALEDALKERKRHWIAELGAQAYQ
jgi:hypothetical protein